MLLRAIPLLPIVLVCACKNEPAQSEIKPTPGPVVQVSAAPVAAPVVASAAAIKPPEGAPACTVSERKVWASGANKLTGLSVVDLGEGKYGVGLAVGIDPHVLVVESNGDGRLVKVPVVKGSHLANPPKSDEGTRKIMRVTPSKVDGEKVYAFVDYRDEYKDKRRRVSCGPADNNDAWGHYDGTPWLDRPEKPTGEEREKLLKGHDYDRGHHEDESAAKVDENEDEKGYHELRDCRTFSDGSKTWIVGSELEADEKEDKSLEWKSTLVVDTGHKDNEVHLHEIVLKGDPPQLASFEIPVSHAFDDGSLLLATRWSSSLRVGILGKNKRLKSKLASFPGFPTIPSITEDGEDLVLVTSVTKEKGHFALRGMRVSQTSPALPKKLTAIDTHMGDAGHDHAHGHDDELDHHDHSETDPTFVRDTKGRRWLSFIEGKRGSGKLEIVPINEKFEAIGKRFSVLDDKSLAAEARLLPLPEGAFLVVSLRDGDNGVEIVTEQLKCEVLKE